MPHGRCSRAPPPRTTASPGAAFRPGELQGARATFLGTGGVAPAFGGPARAKRAGQASAGFSDFRAVSQPARLLTCGLLWIRGPWVWGVGPHSNGPLRFIFGALFTDQKRSFFWKWAFLDAEPRNRPKRAPQQAQGISHMCAEQNAPKIAPNPPGVGFRHAVTRSAQSVHTACAGLSATKRTALMAGEVIY